MIISCAQTQVKKHWNYGAHVTAGIATGSFLLGAILSVLGMTMFLLLFRLKKKLIIKNVESNPRPLNPVYEDIQSVQQGSVQVSKNIAYGEVHHVI